VAQAINLRGADSQPVGAQDPDGDAEQEQQLEGAAAAARAGSIPTALAAAAASARVSWLSGPNRSPWQRWARSVSASRRWSNGEGEGGCAGVGSTGFLGGWRLAAAASQLGLVSWVLPLDLWITLWTAPLSRRRPLGVRW
jgi:hypothetical protein